MALVPSSGKDEASLFAEACSFVAEHRFYLRKAVDHGDFYKAIRHSLSLANELRSSQLGPQSYYKLYSMVFVELQHLGAYLLETERHGFSLEEVSEIVQYEGNCLPRLYLLVTVGMVRMLAAQESTDEILHDLDSMVRAVQHPVRGLFLRYFLLQAVKDKLPRLQSGMMGAMKFLLGTFKEVVILWQRLRVEAREAKVDSPRAWVLDDHRFSLRLLLGAHLMEISRLEGLTTQVYAEVVLPELLNLVPACEDAAGQAYVLQLIVEVFADAYHLDTLDKILSSCAQVHWSVNLKPLTQHLLRRLTSFLAENHRLGEEQPISARDVFGCFHSHLKQLHSRPRTAATPLNSLLELQLELCMYVLALNTGKESCMELLESTVALLEAPGVPYPLEPKLAQAVVDLMAAPLTQECLASPVLAMSYHKSLLAMMSRNMQAKAALAVVSALLAGDVSLGDREMFQNLFALTDTLLHDETGREDVGEDLMRHLEHDPVVFRKEQETMAQLIHQVRQEDPKMVFEMLSMLWEYFQQGGPHRIIFTVPAMVAAVLQLVGKFGPGMWGQVVKVFDFTQTLCTSLGTLAPQESVRLWLLCAACADKAAAKAEKGKLVQQIASSIDHVLVCLDLHIPEQEARLRGLQLLVGTMRQMQVGLEEADLKKICDRAVALSSKMLSKRFQSKAFSLCCQLFWLPQLNFQDADRGLLCLRRALQSADGAIHSDPLDVGLFVDILNEVIHLFAEGASQVSPVLLSKILALCVQHAKYIGNRVPLDAMRALRAAIAGLAVKQKESVEAVMVGDVYIPYLDIDLRPAEQLPDAEAKI